MICLAYLLGKFLSPLISMPCSTWKTYHKVTTRMGLKQSRQKELYDQKTKGAPFKTDDLVSLFCPAVPRATAPEVSLFLAGSMQGCEADQWGPIPNFTTGLREEANDSPLRPPQTLPCQANARGIPDRSKSSASEESGYEDAEETDDDTYVILQDNSQSQWIISQYCIHLLRKPVRTDLLLYDRWQNSAQATTEENDMNKKKH